MFSVNPHANNVDLTTSTGLKLFERATVGTKAKHNLTNDMDKAEEFMTNLKCDARKFCYGPVTTSASIQVVGNQEGADVINILTDYSKIQKDRIIETAGVIWGCEFNDDNSHNFTCANSDDADENELRARSAMLGTYLENSLTEEGKKSLDNHSKSFLYTNTDGNSVSDGLTMLFIILNLIMPSTKASINNKRSELMNMDPAKYNGDILKMTTRMETLKASIENDSGTEYGDFAIHLFAACEKSKVKGFSDYVSRLRSDWETEDETGTDDEIVRKLTKKWNNECSKPGAKQSSSSSKDSDTAKMLVLLTALVNKSENSNSGNNERRGKRDQTSTSIAEWRKTKSHGDSIYKDGKQYYWCEQHQDGKGLYVTHHPKDHNKPIGKWEHTDRSRNVKSTSTGSSQESKPAAGSSDTKLQLSEKMKAALTSKGLSGSDADDLIKGLQQSTSSDGTDFW